MPKPGLTAVRELDLPFTEPTSHREIPVVGWDHGWSSTSLVPMIDVMQRENECSRSAVDGSTLGTPSGGVRPPRTLQAVLSAIAADWPTEPLQTPAVPPTPTAPVGRPDSDHDGAGTIPKALSLAVFHLTIQTTPHEGRSLALTGGMTWPN